MGHGARTGSSGVMNSLSFVLVLVLVLVIGFD